MYVMSDLQFQTVCNTLSFSLASVMATTLDFRLRSTAVKVFFEDLWAAHGETPDRIGANPNNGFGAVLGKGRETARGRAPGDRSYD